MSISSALSNAVLGLRAAGRGAEVISNNMSNVLTPGYGRRGLDLASAQLGGVRIVGITRHVDAGLASDRRNAESAHGLADLTAGFQARLEGLFGTPGDASSLSGRLSAFESALVTAASRPDQPDRLSDAVFQAKDLAEGLKAASVGIQAARTEADRAIQAQVDMLNGDLQLVKELNVEVTSTRARGGDVSTLLDQRQQAVDRIGALVPVRELPRDRGQIALYSTAGAALVDGSASTIGFEPSHQVTPYLTLSVGQLSGLTINGEQVLTDSTRGALRGGALAAQFAIRDELGVAAQSEVDALARDLIERFQDPAVDPSLGVGDAGLFTDRGLAFDPVNELGIADRLTVNAAVDPAQGGEVWRMRDGINAVAEGPVGEASLLNALSSALNTSRTLASGSFAGQDLTATGLVSAAISSVGVSRIVSEQQLSFTSARLNELTQQQLAEGVDADAELQRLILVEQTYAANAKMIEVLDDLMQLITRI